MCLTHWVTRGTETPSERERERKREREIAHDSILESQSKSPWHTVT